MAEDWKLYLFGDQAYNIQTYRQDLLRNRDNPVLEHFLMKAYDALRSEIYTLPSATRDIYPRFTCVDDVIQWNPTGERLVTLDMAIPAER
ncbi:Acyl transferase/acyl hydrolase/lysophospholipase [Penicillium nucicola]|uniref:Acyl transferase/acyl hydrolase/lysophospholipase n=1 Tax=Penicillium nucicola TaxID=1850975 RepID=UPI002544F2CC|nr:Acyl transferase/acyl hydrolase/lysophospholipase [Penicillium nucicola]KAJ5766819.1 Acyl transferase/acyl hydrolase/lysophospholipase [Penicillium nucicola]